MQSYILFQQSQAEARDYVHNRMLSDFNLKRLHTQPYGNCLYIEVHYVKNIRWQDALLKGFQT
jgi:hypothetical protein